MADAFWIIYVDVIDDDQYSEYTQHGIAAVRLFGGELVVRGGRSDAMEGRASPQRTIVIKFESYEIAIACYRSAEYQAAIRHRRGAAKVELLIVEGFQSAGIS